MMNLFKRKNKQPPTIVGGSGSVTKITDPKSELTDSFYSELDTQNMFLKNGCELQQHIYTNYRDLLVGSERIFVSFRFDWNNYKSDIVLTGRTYDLGGNVDKSVEVLLRTPQIPLVGGCWSNVVAMRMLQGQVLVSTMLENVTNALKYMHYNYDYRAKGKAGRLPKIIKVDRCLYAPFLYLHPNNYTRKNAEYMPYLVENHPQAYQYLLENREGFWSEYHDNDVEVVGSGGEP
jgi:hypothetical protein